MKKVWKYDTGKIGELVGKSRRSVRRDITNGVFDPADLLSVVRYVVRHRGVEIP